MLKTFQMFAAYNQWANARLYAAAHELTPEAYHENKGAFFGSLSGTLNHILAADRIWMKRFTGKGEAPARLDAILHDDLSALHAARTAEDERIITFIDGLTPEAIAAAFSYRTITNPADITQPLGPALCHFFNHQTHHRGQAHMTLTALGQPSLVLDLLYFQRSNEGARFS